MVFVLLVVCLKFVTKFYFIRELRKLQAPKWKILWRFLNLYGKRGTAEECMFSLYEKVLNHSVLSKSMWEVSGMKNFSDNFFVFSLDHLVQEYIGPGFI